MRLVLKIFTAPVVAILTVFVAMMMFLLIATWLMGLVFVLHAIVGVALLFTQKYIGAAAYLLLAFLASPYGFPTMAVWLLARVQYLNYTLRDFITS
ncbi:MAG TPA: hypothetical protein IAA26_11615 [Candidatus Blautia faecipullorum]|nr:hypothetical protein [Candidatus Blautia faecipullorum]